MSDDLVTSSNKLSLVLACAIIIYLQNGGTALGFATYSGKVDVIQILLEHEASVNVKDTVSCNSNIDSCGLIKIILTYL